MFQNPAIESEPTPGEQLASVVTHGVGLIGAVTATVLLVVFASLAGGAIRITTLSIFGATLMAVYASSTLYHMAKEARLRRFMRKLDHISIFLLIAGTYTPLLLVTLRGGWGWSLFGVVWAMAAAGLTLKLLCFDRFGWTQLALKVGMGWLLVVGIGPMVAAMSTPGMAWVVAGGLAYTVGVVFFLWERLKYNHAIWHVFVLAGSTCHVMAMVTDVLPAG